MQTTTPDPRGSYYGCQLCPDVHFQVIEPMLDDNGDPVLDWEGTPRVKNNEDLASAESRAHASEKHPEPVNLNIV